MKGLQLVVESAEAARAELAGRGVDVGEVQDFPWGRFVFFSDPDGNAWAVQEIQRPGGQPAAWPRTRARTPARRRAGARDPSAASHRAHARSWPGTRSPKRVTPSRNAGWTASNDACSAARSSPGMRSTSAPTADSGSTSASW